MDTLPFRTSLLLLLLAIPPTGGCSSSSSSQTDAVANTGGEGQPGPASSPSGGDLNYGLCQTICAHAVQAGCSQAMQVSCATNCAKHAESVPGCHALATDLSRCQSVSEVKCDADGSPSFPDCAKVEEAYLTCVDKVAATGGGGGESGAAGSGTDDGGSGDWPYLCGVSQATPCHKCWATTCCEFEQACANDYECDILRNAIGSCTSFEYCKQKEIEQHPAGVEKYNALMDCLHTKCPCGQ